MSSRTPSESGPRVVLVTGASSGIGRAVALELADRGEHLVLAARSEETLDEVSVECERRGSASVRAVVTDVGDDAQVAACVEQALDAHGRLDVVVHAAGVVSYGRTEEVPPEVFDGVLRTNLTGAVNMSRHVVPVMRAQGSGTIVILGSIIGHVAVPTMSPYVLSKWGVRALARQLHVENLDVPGLHVCHVAPGGVDTPIYQQAANVIGREGRPPPPVMSAERAGHLVVRRIDSPRQSTQLTPANHVLRAGFTFAPAVYDRIVGPLFSRIAVDQGRPLTPTTGNVLAPRPDGNALVGSSRALLGSLLSAPAGIARRLIPGSGR